MYIYKRYRSTMNPSSVKWWDVGRLDLEAYSRLKSMLPLLENRQGCRHCNENATGTTGVDLGHFNTCMTYGGAEVARRCPLKLRHGHLHACEEIGLCLSSKTKSTNNSSEVCVRLEFVGVPLVVYYCTLVTNDLLISTSSSTGLIASSGI